jgi:hypothetical protein
MDNSNSAPISINTVNPIYHDRETTNFFGDKISQLLCQPILSDVNIFCSNEIGEEIMLYSHKLVLSFSWYVAKY